MVGKGKVSAFLQDLMIGRAEGHALEQWMAQSQYAPNMPLALSSGLGGTASASSGGASAVDREAARRTVRAVAAVIRVALQPRRISWLVRVRIPRTLMRYVTT